MHAIVGASTMPAELGTEFAEGILAGMQKSPGFVSGTFTRSADRTRGRSMVLFESEEAAVAAREAALAAMPDNAPITIESVEVYEVVANA